MATTPTPVPKHHQPIRKKVILIDRDLSHEMIRFRGGRAKENRLRPGAVRICAGGSKRIGGCTRANHAAEFRAFLWATAGATAIPALGRQTWSAARAKAAPQRPIPSVDL